MKMYLVQAKHLFVYGLKLASKMLIIPNKVCYTTETQSISLLLTLWLSLYFQNMTLWSRGMPVLYHWNFATFTFTFTFTLLQFGQNMTFWSWEMPVHYAAIESNRELNKSLEVNALFLLIFGPNLIILFFTGVKP